MKQGRSRPCITRLNLTIVCVLLAAAGCQSGAGVGAGGSGGTGVGGDAIDPGGDPGGTGEDPGGAVDGGGAGDTGGTGVGGDATDPGSDPGGTGEDPGGAGDGGDNPDAGTDGAGDGGDDPDAGTDGAGDGGDDPDAGTDGAGDDGDDGNADGLPSGEQRVVFLSQCAQSVIECTSSWPTAVAEIVAGYSQTVTETANGYLVEGDDGNGSELIQLQGSDSIAGNGATEIFYSWSLGADDPDPRTMEAGDEFSTEADPDVLLQTGFHYLRLTVFNDIMRDRVESEEFGLIAENVPSYHFVEFEIEVRD